MQSNPNESISIINNLTDAFIPRGCFKTPDVEKNRDRMAILWLQREHFKCTVILGVLIEYWLLQ